MFTTAGLNFSANPARDGSFPAPTADWAFIGAISKPSPNNIAMMGKVEPNDLNFGR